MDKIKTFLSNRENLKLIGGVVAGLILGLAFILIFNPFNIKRLYLKPKAWIISQGLHSTLTKQQLLLKSAKRGQVSLDNLAKIATTSTNIKAEAVKIGKDYLLSTDASGKVDLSIDPGTYRVELVKIPGIDFTGVPGTIKIERGDYVLNVGLIKGSGKVRAEGGGLKMEDGQESKLQINLFSDKNGNGKKQDGEPYLYWSGVTIKLKLNPA